MVYKWLLLLVLGIVLFIGSVTAGYVLQTYFLADNTQVVHQPEGGGTTTLVDEVATKRMAEVAKQELKALPEIKVRLIGEVGDKSTYSYAMSLNTPPGDENPVWTAACRVVGQETVDKTLELYINDKDYQQSVAADKQTQLETFLLSCLIAQDENFKILTLEQKREELLRLYEQMQDQGVQLLQESEGGV